MIRLGLAQDVVADASYAVFRCHETPRAGDFVEVPGLATYKVLYVVHPVAEVRPTDPPYGNTVEYPLVIVERA